MDSLNYNGISFMDRVPSYIKRDSCFYKFIENLHNYVMLSWYEPIQKFISTFFKLGGLTAVTYNDFVKSIANRMGITTKYSNLYDVDPSQLPAIYAYALQGNAVARQGDATYASLLNQLMQLFNTTEDNISIVDGGLDASTGIMRVNVSVKKIVSMDTARLALYFKQDITGVDEEFHFTRGGELYSLPIIATTTGGVTTYKEATSVAEVTNWLSSLISTDARQEACWVTIVISGGGELNSEQCNTYNTGKANTAKIGQFQIEFI